MFGPGKYDKECRAVRTVTLADGVILIVFRGHSGDGFSAQLPADELARIPTLLRTVADQIEADNRSHASRN